MLEVLLVLFLAKKIAAILKAKGRSPTWYVVALVAFWIAGEVLGGILGVVATDGATAGAYVCALLGAVLGAIAAFVLANSAAPLYIDGGMTGGFPVQPPISPQQYGGVSSSSQQFPPR